MTNMKKNIFLITLCIACSLSSLPAQKNAQWRGAERNGIYNETGLLKVWPAGGPQLLWKYEKLGDGYTSAAIANEKLYITGLDGKKLILFVFDLTGKLLTRKEVGSEWTSNYIGPRCTVVVNDGKLYINNSLGTLVCLDEETLNQVWKKNLLTDFDGKNIMWGMTESPLIVGEKLYITPGGAKHNMVALNKNTGALIWSSPGEGTTSSYCSPLYIGSQTVPIVVTSTMKHVIAFHADTGEKLWSHPQLPQNPARNIHPNTPIYDNGMIFTTTGYRGGSMLLRIRDGGKAVEQVWKNSADNQIGGAIKYGDYVYTSGHNNRGFYCIDWKNGDYKYRESNFSPSAMIFADGMLYVYGENGNMKLIKPNPEKYELVSSFKVTQGTGQHWAHPVIHNGVLYIRHGNAIMAYKIT
jgi:outer membrane protein assembly factor BamB